MTENKKPYAELISWTRYPLETLYCVWQKSKLKSNEFLLLMGNDKFAWKLIPDQKEKSFLEPKLKEALSLVMSKKEITSPKLASLLNENEEISVKNARIRLEKLFHFRLVNKLQGIAKEYSYRSLF